MATVNGQTYFLFDNNGVYPSDDVVSDTQDIASGLWSGNNGTLNAIYLNPAQTASSGQYYIDAYNYPQTSTTNTPEVQFSIAYGHKYGSGSSILNEQYPTRAIYSQYKNILLEPTDEFFTIGGVNKTHILVVNFNLSRVKQILDPGNWQLSLSSGSDAGGEYLTLIDDSGQSATATYNKAGRRYNVVSGTIAAGAYSPTATYGLVYPDAGLVVLNPDAINDAMPLPCNVSSSNVAAVNTYNLFNAVSWSMASGSGFIARNTENIASTHYFVRVKNQAFNFSNNPTFVTGSLGDLYNQDMIKNPTVYITSIGLYNDNNELLAVAKLSQPLKKTFNNEALVRVKLDF